MKKLYEVNAKCGHVGRGKYINISFPIVASSGKSAARIGRYMGRVKHDWKDAINYVREITVDEYEELVAINQEDQYLQCRNIQMQKSIVGIKDRVQVKENVVYTEKEKNVDYILKKHKIQENSARVQIDDYLNCSCF